MSEFIFSFVNKDKFFHDSIFDRDDALKMIARKDKLECLSEYFIQKLRLNPEETDRNQVIIDFNIEFLQFCFAEQFTAEKIATFLSISNYCLFHGLFKKSTALDINQHVLKLLQRHSKNVQPYSILIFNELEVKKIMDFINNFTKNFFLYEIALTRFIDYNIFTKEPLGIIPEIKPASMGKIINAEEMIKIQGLEMYLEMAEGNLEEDNSDDEKDLITKVLSTEEIKPHEDILQRNEKLIEKTPEQLLSESMIDTHLNVFSKNLEIKIDSDNKDLDEILKKNYPKLFPKEVKPKK